MVAASLGGIGHIVAAANAEFGRIFGSIAGFGAEA
jgi:hypothetical protein